MTHWYHADGRPCYTVPRADGQGDRPATLADARRLGLRPGVSTVLSVAARPGLERWRREQAILAALTMPRQPGETEAQLVARILEDADAEAAHAAELGSAIHAEVAALFRGEETDVSLGARNAWIVVSCAYGVTGWHVEDTFTSPLWYGGKVDLWRGDLVVDYKSVDDIAAKSRLAWPEHAMQLAAYAHGVDAPDALLVSVYVCRKTGRVRPHEWPGAEAKLAWRQFQALLTYWQLANRYGPEY